MRLCIPLVLGLLGCATKGVEPPAAPETPATPAVAATDGPEVKPPATPAVAAPAGVDGLWVIQIRRQLWQPRDLEFVLRLEFEGAVPKGVATVDPVFIGRTTASLVELQIEGERIRFSLRSKGDDIVYNFDGRRDAGSIDGKVRWNDGRSDRIEPFTAHRREVRRFDSAVERFRVEQDPRQVGVEPVLLDRLILGAETARSDALIVLADGRLVAARTFGGEDAPASVGSLSAAVTEIAHGERDFPGGLRLRPSELAALGQALLDGGKWTGEPTVPLPWMSALAAPADSASPRLGPSWDREIDPTDVDRKRVLGFGRVTEAGEGLLVYPEARLVVVRTVNRPDSLYDRRYDARDVMEWLSQMAESIAVEKLGRAIRVNK